MHACIKLVRSCLSNSFTPPTDTTTLLVARYLLIKTLVAWQLFTNMHTCTHTHTHTGMHTRTHTCTHTHTLASTYTAKNYKFAGMSDECVYTLDLYTDLCITNPPPPTHTYKPAHSPKLSSKSMRAVKKRTDYTLTCSLSFCYILFAVLTCCSCGVSFSIAHNKQKTCISTQT